MLKRLAVWEKENIASFSVLECQTVFLTVKVFQGVKPPKGTSPNLTGEQFDLYNIPFRYEVNQEVLREYCEKNWGMPEGYRQLQRKRM